MTLVTLESSLDERQYANSAVVAKVSGGSLQGDGLEEICTALTVVQRRLAPVGGYVVMVHGAGKQLDKAVAEAGLPNEKVDDLRWTDDAVYEVVKKVMYGIRGNIVDAFRRNGAEALPMPRNVLVSRNLGPAYGGRVGMPLYAQVGIISQAVNGHKPILVVTSLAQDVNGRQYDNVNSDDAAAALAISLRAKVWLNITHPGGILADVNDGNSIIRDLRVDEARKYVSGGASVKVNAVERALDASPQLLVRVISQKDIPIALYQDCGSRLHR